VEKGKQLAMKTLSEDTKLDFQRSEPEGQRYRKYKLEG
jgi:hypothetical protein